SSARAYLRPARKRGNLTVETGAHATRVLMRGTHTTGVEYVTAAGERKQVDATREVIVSTGAFNAPQLLLLSGIGRSIHLREMGITCVADLPVGRNLQDHIGAYMTYERRSPGVFHGEMRFDRMAVSMIRAYLFGTGPATVVPGGLHAFIKSRPELAVPDIELMFRGTSHHPPPLFPLIYPAYRDGFGIRPTLLHPDSHGEVLLRSVDPRAARPLPPQFFPPPTEPP